MFITQDGGTIDNEACVDPDNEVIGEQRGEGQLRHEEHARRGPVAKPLGPEGRSERSVPGETITYTVTVSNIGNANAAEPVTITDELHGLGVRGHAVATNGFTCP